MRPTTWFVVLAVLMFSGTSVLAASKSAKPRKTDKTEESDSRERDARKACLEGNPEKGVSILNELFLDTKSPALIFNQGRCYEQNERYKEAINRFREYLRMTSEFADLAQKHIDECQALDGQKHRELPSPAAQPPTPAATTTPATVQPAETVANPAAPVAKSGSSWCTAGLITAGVGVALIGTGVVLNLKANSLASDITPPNTYKRGTEADRKGYETLSWISYSVGAAAIAAGATLFGIGWSRSNASGTLAFAPVLSPRCAGASLVGAF